MSAPVHNVTAPATIIVNPWPKGWAAVEGGFAWGFGFLSGCSVVVFIGTVIARTLRWVFA